MDMLNSETFAKQVLDCSVSSEITGCDSRCKRNVIWKKVLLGSLLVTCSSQFHGVLTLARECLK